MLGGGCLDPDGGDAHVDEVGGDEHGGLEGGTHADDGAAELARAQLLEGVLGGGVSFDQGETTREGLHARGVLFDGQDLVAELVLCDRDGGPEAAQSDDECARLEVF